MRQGRSGLSLAWGCGHCAGLTSLPAGTRADADQIPNRLNEEIIAIDILPGRPTDTCLWTGYPLACHGCLDRGPFLTGVNGRMFIRREESPAQLSGWDRGGEAVFAS